MIKTESEKILADESNFGFAAKCQICSSGLARNLGNANCDSAVNIADFVIWKDEYLQSNGAVKTNYQADFDCDSKVTMTDFVKWKSGYLQ
jgi:hypothetical protein